MEKELIKITTNEDGQKLVSARELHEGLKVKSKFNDWITKRITKYGFEENQDFILVTQKKITRNPKNPYTEQKDYVITIDMAKQLCRIERRNKKSLIILNYLLNIDNKESYIIEPQRKEIEFGVMLEKITGFHFIEQYPIDKGKYKLDFMLETEDLIIEYDEEHHKYNKEKDKERINYCRQWLKENVYFENWDCPVIRVEEGKELEGIREIIEHLVAYEHLYSWDYKCIRG